MTARHQASRSETSLTPTLAAHVANKGYVDSVARGMTVNVKAYGAVGDGTTDDSAAFTSAITAATAGTLTGNTATVFVPEGNYVTGPLVLPNRVGIKGMGPGSTQIKLKAASTGPVVKNATNARMCFVSDIRLDGNKGSVSNVNSHGLLLDNSAALDTDPANSISEWVDARHIVSNVVIQNTKGSGFVQKGRGVVAASNVQVWLADGHGFDANVDSSYVACDTGASGLDGFIIRSGGNRFSSCKAWYSGRVATTGETDGCGHGWHIANGTYSANVYSACEAQDNARAGFYANNGGRQTFTGCNADSNNTANLGHAGVEILASYMVRWQGISWDRAANTNKQLAGGRISGGGGCSLDMAVDGVMAQGALTSDSVTSAHTVQVVHDTLPKNFVHGALNMQGYAVTSLPTPTVATDAATKGYVDGLAMTAYHANVGTGSAGPYTLTHNLNSWDVGVVVSRNGGHAANIDLANPTEIIDVQIVPTGPNTVVLKPDETWATGQFHAAVYPIQGGDVAGPTGGTVAESGVLSNQVTATISGVTDPSTVTFYSWDLNGTFVARTAAGTPTYTYTGLSSSTAYTLGCTAIDLRGNRTRFTRTSTTTASASVLFDAVSTPTAATGSQAGWSGTNAITVGSGTNRILIVSIVTQHSGGAIDGTTGFGTKTVSSNNGGALTLLGAVNNDNGNLGSTFVYYMLNPPSGAHTISVNFISSGNWYGGFRMAAASYSNVVGIVQRATRSGQAAGTLSLNATSAVGDIAGITIGLDAAAPVSFNQTQRASAGAAATGTGDFIFVGDAPGAASVTFSHTGNQFQGAITYDLVKG